MCRIIIVSYLHVMWNIGQINWQPKPVKLMALLSRAIYAWCLDAGKFQQDIQVRNRFWNSKGLFCICVTCEVTELKRIFLCWAFDPLEIFLLVNATDTLLKYTEQYVNWFKFLLLEAVTLKGADAYEYLCLLEVVE
jgi:hypothetical protein